MNLLELLDYSDGNTINNRLTDISVSNIGNKLGRLYLNYLQSTYSVNKKILLANGIYYITPTVDLFTQFSLDDIYSLFNLSKLFYRYGISPSEDDDSVPRNYMNDYWLNIISPCYLNILSSENGLIYNIIIDESDIGFTLKGKVSGSYCCAIKNSGGGGGSYWKDGAIAGAAVGAAIGTVIPGLGNVIGSILGGIIGGIAGALFGKFKKPSKDCAASVAFIGVLYFIKPYYNEKGKLVADYKFYFKKDPDLNYDPYTLSYSYGNSTKISKELVNMSGTMKLLDKFDISKFDKQLLVAGSYSLKVKSSGLIKRHKTYRGSSGVQFGVGMYKHDGNIVISFHLCPIITGTAAGYYVSKAYTLVDKLAMILSTDDNELKSQLDSLFVNTDITAGCSSFWVSDPLDATNDPHLLLKHFRGYLNLMPDNINYLYPPIKINDVISFNNTSYYCSEITDDQPNWVNLPSGETPLIVDSEVFKG